MTITIKTGNAAFSGSLREFEIARILRLLAERIENGNTPDVLIDINGSHVGTVRGK